MRPLLSTHCRHSDSICCIRGASRMAPTIFGPRGTSFAWYAATRTTSRKPISQPHLVDRREHD